MRVSSRPWPPHSEGSARVKKAGLLASPLGSIQDVRPMLRKTAALALWARATRGERIALVGWLVNAVGWAMFALLGSGVMQLVGAWLGATALCMFVLYLVAVARRR
jgi:hypothetical protein